MEGKYRRIKKVDVIKIDDPSLIVQPISIPNHHLNEGLNPNVMQHPATTYITASCGKGKTNLIVWLLLTHYKQFFENIYIFSNTLHQDIWKNLKLDMSKCFNKYSDALFIAVREDIKNHKGEKTLVIFDDMTGGTAYSKRTSPLLEFICNHRHFPSSDSGCSLWFISHSFKSLPKIARTVINSLIVYETSSADELEAIINDQRGTVSYGDFLKYIYEPATCEEYHFLHINRKKPFLERFSKDFDIQLKLELDQ